MRVVGSGRLKSLLGAYGTAYDVPMDVVHKYRWAQKPVCLIRTCLPRMAALIRAPYSRLTSVDTCICFQKLTFW